MNPQPVRSIKAQEQSVVTNVYFNTAGQAKRIGYSSFEGLLRVLTKANNYALKTGFMSEIRIMLPIKKRSASTNGGKKGRK